MLRTWRFWGLVSKGVCIGMGCPVDLVDLLYHDPQDWLLTDLILRSFVLRKESFR